MRVTVTARYHAPGVGTLEPGDVVDVPTRDAQRMIALHAAAAAEDDQPVTRKIAKKAPTRKRR